MLVDFNYIVATVQGTDVPANMLAFVHLVRALFGAGPALDPSMLRNVLVVLLPAVCTAMQLAFFGFDEKLFIKLYYLDYSETTENLRQAFLHHLCLNAFGLGYRQAQLLGINGRSLSVNGAKYEVHGFEYALRFWIRQHIFTKVIYPEEAWLYPLFRQIDPLTVETSITELLDYLFENGIAPASLRNCHSPPFLLYSTGGYRRFIRYVLETDFSDHIEKVQSMPDAYHFYVLLCTELSLKIFFYSIL